MARGVGLHVLVHHRRAGDAAPQLLQRLAAISPAAHGGVQAETLHGHHPYEATRILDLLACEASGDLRCDVLVRHAGVVEGASTRDLQAGVFGDYVRFNVAETSAGWPATPAPIS